MNCEQAVMWCRNSPVGTKRCLLSLSSKGGFLNVKGECVQTHRRNEYCHALSCSCVLIHMHPWDHSLSSLSVCAGFISKIWNTTCCHSLLCTCQISCTALNSNVNGISESERSRSGLEVQPCALGRPLETLASTAFIKLLIFLFDDDIWICCTQTNSRKFCSMGISSATSTSSFYKLGTNAQPNVERAIFAVRLFHIDSVVVKFVFRSSDVISQKSGFRYSRYWHRNKTGSFTAIFLLVGTRYLQRPCYDANAENMGSFVALVEREVAREGPIRRRFANFPTRDRYRRHTKKRQSWRFFFLLFVHLKQATFFLTLRFGKSCI